MKERLEKLKESFMSRYTKIISDENSLGITIFMIGLVAGLIISELVGA